MIIAIPDDYQDCVRQLDCFAKLAGHEVRIFNDSVKGTDALAERFADAEAIVLTRERTRIDAALLDRLPKLRLISQTGKHYRDVRKKLLELGTDEFTETYITDDVLAMMEQFANAPEVSMSDDELEAARSLNQPAANSRADKAKGPFSLYKELDGITIRMDCAWYPDPIPAQYIWQERPAGWYCRIVDAEMAVRLSFARKDGTGATDALIGEAPHTRTSSASVAFAASYLGADIV